MTASPAILNGRCHCLEKCDKSKEFVKKWELIKNLKWEHIMTGWGGGGKFLRTLIADMLLEGGVPPSPSKFGGSEIRTE